MNNMWSGRPLLYLVSDASPLVCQKNAVKFGLLYLSPFPPGLCTVVRTRESQNFRSYVPHSGLNQHGQEHFW